MPTMLGRVKKPADQSTFSLAICRIVAPAHELGVGELAMRCNQSASQHLTPLYIMTALYRLAGTIRAAHLAGRPPAWT